MNAYVYTATDDVLTVLLTASLLLLRQAAYVYPCQRHSCDTNICQWSSRDAGRRHLRHANTGQQG